MEKLLILAVGGAGMTMAAHIQPKLTGVYIALNTAEDVLRGDFDQRIAITDNLSIHLEQVMRNHKKLLVLLGLGGTSGSTMAPLIAKLAPSLGVACTFALTLPFAFEKQRRKEALQQLKNLELTPCTLLLSDNEAAYRALGHSSISMEDFFARQAQRMAKSIQGAL